MAALNTDGKTPQVIKVNSVNKSIKVVDSNTGSDFSVASAPRDENRVPVMLGVSDADGVTPVELYADVNGNLLIQST